MQRLRRQQSSWGWMHWSSGPVFSFNSARSDIFPGNICIFIWQTPRRAFLNLHFLQELLYIQRSCEMPFWCCRTQARIPSLVLETLQQLLNSILITPIFIITEARWKRLRSFGLICTTIWLLEYSPHVSFNHFIWAVSFFHNGHISMCNRCTCSLTRSTQPLWISTKQSPSSPTSQWLTFRSSTLTTGKPLLHNRLHHV